MVLALGIVLIVLAVFLIVAVLLQSGKDTGGLSGAIGGGADTFFSKSKSATWDKMLSRATSVVAIVFTLVVIVMYIIVT